MKKQLSTAMAAAMAFGTVVPAFAAETKANSNNNIAKYEVDVRTAKGIKLDTIKGSTTKATVYKREEVFNYNGYKDTERSKHTLKNSYKDYEVLFVEENRVNASQDLVVLGKKLDLTNVTNKNQVDLAKAQYDSMLSQIDLLEKNGYEKQDPITVSSKIVPDGKDNYTYEAGYQVITLKPKDNKLSLPTYEFKFNNIDSGLVNDTDVNTIREEVFGSLEIKDTTTAVTIEGTKKDKITIDFLLNEKDTTAIDEVYAATNKLKFAIENNKEKFDIVVDETGTGNSGKLVKLYVKGAQKDDTKTLVMTLTFKNIKSLDSKKIVDMPLLKDSDFKGHWAEKTIVDAMLSGYVDASTTFRPKDSVTRAEFAKMLCTVLGIEYKDGQEEPFHDVANDSWYHKYIAALYNVNDKQGLIINGYADSTFKPNDAITRQEAAKMIAQAFLLKDKEGKLLNNEGKVLVERVTDTNKGKVEKKFVTLDKAKEYGIEVSYKVNSTIVNADIQTTFKDDAEIKDWADASVQALYESGVIKGYEDKTFKPNNSITRVEALLMITGDNNKK